MDVDVRAVYSPCIRSNGIGYQGAEQATEVEEKEDREDPAGEKLNEEDPVVALAVEQRVELWNCRTN